MDLGAESPSCGGQNDSHGRSVFLYRMTLQEFGSLGSGKEVENWVSDQKKESPLLFEERRFCLYVSSETKKVPTYVSDEKGKGSVLDIELGYLFVYKGGAQTDFIENCLGNIDYTKCGSVCFATLDEAKLGESAASFNHYCVDENGVHFIQKTSTTKFWLLDKFGVDAEHATCVKEDGVEIYFYVGGGSKESSVLREYCKSKALELRRLRNCFEDDETENYLAIFGSDQMEELSFALSMLLFKGNPGYAVYLHDISSLHRGLSFFPDERTFLLRDIDNDRKFLEFLYRRSGEPYDPAKLPECLSDAVFVAASSQMVTLGRYMNSHYAPYKRAFKSKYEPPKSFKDKLRSEHPEIPEREYPAKWLEHRRRAYNKIAERNKAEATRIADALAARGEAFPTWKSEYWLFQVARILYSDAIFQYGARWLGRQKIDVYIPSINVGIEFQGPQHYEATRYFGGKDKLRDTRRRDFEKIEKCAANRTSLLYFDGESDMHIVRVLDALERILCDSEEKAAFMEYGERGYREYSELKDLFEEFGRPGNRGKP